MKKLVAIVFASFAAIAGSANAVTPAYRLNGAQMPGIVASSCQANTNCLYFDTSNFLNILSSGTGGAQSMVNALDANQTYTLKVGQVLGSTGSVYSVLKSITPSEAAADTWYEGITHSLFHGTRQDQVLTMGWNFQPNGTRVNTSDATIGDQWESYYEADATHQWVERHIVFIGTDGTYQRPLTMQIMRTSGMANPLGYTAFGIAADNFWISGSPTNATQNFQFLNPLANAAGTFLVNNSSQIRLNTNNVPQLTQENLAGNGAYTLAYVGADNNVHLGDSTTQGFADGTTFTISGNAVLGGSSSKTITYTGLVSGTIPFTAAASTISVAQTTVDTAGKALTIVAGIGGNASATGGGVGGTSQYNGGNGGNGVSALAPGAGGPAVLEGGAAGSGGTGNANGGNAYVRGGPKAGTGTNGDAHIGDAVTAHVYIAEGAQLGFLGAAAVSQQNGTGNTHTVAAGATTTVFTNTTFDGSVGTTAYTVGDVVKALKNYGLLAQ